MRNRNRPSLSGYFALVLLPLSLSASAATVTWDGAGADNNLSTPTNWLGGFAPAPHDALVFNGFARLSPVNDYSAGTAFDGIAFAPTAGAFALNGNQVTLHGDIADNTPVLSQTINLALALDGIRNIGVTDNAFLTIAGPISGAGFGPTKAGNGTLLLTGANTFTGPLSINAGVVSV